MTLLHLYTRYIKRGRCPYVRNVRSSVTLGVTSSLANDVTMTIAGLWRYGDWRHVATGCADLVIIKLIVVNNSYSNDDKY